MEVVKALFITRCNDSLRWYRAKVGKLVSFRGDAGFGEYRSTEPEGFTNFVQHHDAIVCNVPATALPALLADDAPAVTVCPVCNYVVLEQSLDGVTLRCADCHQLEA